MINEDLTNAQKEWQELSGLEIASNMTNTYFNERLAVWNKVAKYVGQFNKKGERGFRAITSTLVYKYCQNHNLDYWTDEAEQIVDTFANSGVFDYDAFNNVPKAGE